MGYFFLGLLLFLTYFENIGGNQSQNDHSCICDDKYKPLPECMNAVLNATKIIASMAGHCPLAKVRKSFQAAELKWSQKCLSKIVLFEECCQKENSCTKWKEEKSKYDTKIKAIEEDMKNATGLTFKDFKP